MIDIYSFTSPGGREYNEDFVGSSMTPDGAVLTCADGLGGHKGGDIASRIVVDTMLTEPYDDAPDDRAWLDERINAANQVITDRQAELGNKMKSTVVALKISGFSATWAHLGDSRLYYIRDNAVVHVTEDHSVAFKKYKAGEISRAAIATDEDQPSLLRALGNSGRLRPEFGSPDNPLAVGDAFLLCTDGFWEYVQDQEILFDYLKTNSAQTWAELLLLRVMDRLKDDSDNLSVITAIIR